MYIPTVDKEESSTPSPVLSFGLGTHINIHMIGEMSGGLRPVDTILSGYEDHYNHGQGRVGLLVVYIMLYRL